VSSGGRLRRRSPTSSLGGIARSLPGYGNLSQDHGDVRSSEFYNLRASPDLVGTRVDRDIPLPSNVRRYYFPGVSHGGGPGGFNPEPQPQACCELYESESSSDTLRALQTALVDWVVKGTLLHRASILVWIEENWRHRRKPALGFPTIPECRCRRVLTPLYEYDFGTRFKYNDLSGVMTIQPPPVRQILPTCGSKSGRGRGMRWLESPACSIRFL